MGWSCPISLCFAPNWPIAASPFPENVCSLQPFLFSKLFSGSWDHLGLDSGSQFFSCNRIWSRFQAQKRSQVSETKTTFCNRPLVSVCGRRHNTENECTLFYTKVIIFELVIILMCPFTSETTSFKPEPRESFKGRHLHGEPTKRNNDASHCSFAGAVWYRIVLCISGKSNVITNCTLWRRASSSTSKYMHVGSFGFMSLSGHLHCAS